MREHELFIALGWSETLYTKTIRDDLTRSETRTDLWPAQDGDQQRGRRWRIKMVDTGGHITMYDVTRWPVEDELYLMTCVNYSWMIGYDDSEDGSTGNEVWMIEFWRETDRRTDRPMDGHQRGFPPSVVDRSGWFGPATNRQHDCRGHLPARQIYWPLLVSACLPLCFPIIRLSVCLSVSPTLIRFAWVWQPMSSLSVL